MAKLIWIFLRNIFENITAKNNRKMDSLSTDHDLKLTADMLNPIIAVIYNIFHPLRLDFHNTYVSYKAALADSHGKTVELQDFWALASSEKYDHWDSLVKNVYPRKSMQHEGLFPRGHDPFREGNEEERISHIEALKSNLSKDSALSAAETEVDNFLTSYYALKTSHAAKEKLIRDLAAEVKTKSKICATAMYADLGYLIWKFPAAPDTIGGYFNVSEIVSTTAKSEGGESDELTIAVPNGKSVEGDFVFEDATKIRAYNPGGETLYLFTKAVKETNPPIPDDAMALLPEDDKQIIMYTLGVAGNRYFYIGNKGTSAGEIVIDLV
ncbi:MAG: hypothetical protein NTV24_04760 [Candidatus Woesebacteria bacterium]|nr:hypothetical protein [Candidatus Woesebacteria bacterium]